MNQIHKGTYNFSKDMVAIYQEEDIENQIQSDWENIDKVAEASVLIDKPKNMLIYENDTTEGILVNVSSRSIQQLYNKFLNQGLFDMNIRKFVSNKMVDKGINDSLDNDRENFWFLNNGLIIACDSYNVDGNKIKLYGFSIVNGGQTTTLIGKYKGKNSKEFYIPCKIIADKEKQKGIDFFSKIAEATNSQKPIYARDLKSNSPEMKRLQKWLLDENVYLEIKRGDIKNKKYKIKNDELGQLIFSFVYQKPGTSRSGKKAIFENNDFYKRIFRQNYEKDAQKQKFILDLIDLNQRFVSLSSSLEKGKELDLAEKDILKNGKQIIFAIMGVLYLLENNDLTLGDLNDDILILKTVNFVYGAFISNYKNDDLEDKIKRLIINIVQLLQEYYINEYEKGACTSISNFFKTDLKYYNEIMKPFSKALQRSSIGKDIMKDIDLFKR